MTHCCGYLAPSSSYTTLSLLLISSSTPELTGRLFYLLVTNFILLPSDMSEHTGAVLSLVVCVSSLLYLSYFKTFQADDMSTWDASVIVLIATVCLSTCILSH